MLIDDGGSVWFPFVFPILFPIIFPMGFMMLVMMRRHGSMGMMMGGHPRQTRARFDPSTGPSRGDGTDRVRGAGGGTIRPESPLEVAQRRYAAGEIGRDEFQRIREDLDAR